MSPAPARPRGGRPLGTLVERLAARADRRHLQPVPRRAARAAARPLPRVSAPTRRSCSSARRPDTAARASRASRSRPSASSRARGRARRPRRSSTACSKSSSSRTPCCSGTSCRRILARRRANRAPTRREVEAGLPFARELARGRRVLAVGRVAEAALGAPYVRHPSHGGATAFRETLRACLT